MVRLCCLLPYCCCSCFLFLSMLLFCPGGWRRGGREGLKQETLRPERTSCVKGNSLLQFFTATDFSEFPCSYLPFSYHLPSFLASVPHQLRLTSSRLKGNWHRDGFYSCFVSFWYSCTPFLTLSLSISLSLIRFLPLRTGSCLLWQVPLDVHTHTHVQWSWWGSDLKLFWEGEFDASFAYSGCSERRNDWLVGS